MKCIVFEKIKLLFRTWKMSRDDFDLLARTRQESQAQPDTSQIKQSNFLF